MQTREYLREPAGKNAITALIQWLALPITSFVYSKPAHKDDYIKKSIVTVTFSKLVRLGGAELVGMLNQVGGYLTECRCPQLALLRTGPGDIDIVCRE